MLVGFVQRTVSIIITAAVLVVDIFVDTLTGLCAGIPVVIFVVRASHIQCSFHDDNLLFSSHSATTLGAVGGITQNTHSDKISAGIADKPITGCRKTGKEMRSAVMAIASFSHVDSSSQFLEIKIYLQRSQIYFQFRPSTEQTACAVKPQLGQFLLSINTILSVLSGE